MERITCKSLVVVAWWDVEWDYWRGWFVLSGDISKVNDPKPGVYRIIIEDGLLCRSMTVLYLNDEACWRLTISDERYVHTLQAENTPIELIANMLEL